ncbi:MAG: protoporphyrinogen oxidase HemJ [Myxococcales bacterium]|nr:protoporphyrinogen oxidase HemJ [Myxococcota bacterium]MDW8284024.1 protoporphyrinogen oxidase HemJ [Myxococcales bacterium]
MPYLWIKAFHVVFVVAWFAGLFYLPRLYAYHTRHREQPAMAQVFMEMERKLLRIIMDPALGLTLVLGIALLVLSPHLLRQGWMHAKLTVVLLLIGYHVLLALSRRRLARGDYFLSERAWRALNEVPTLLLIAAVVLVIVRPF